MDTDEKKSRKIYGKYSIFQPLTSSQFIWLCKYLNLHSEPRMEGAEEKLWEQLKFWRWVRRQAEENRDMETWDTLEADENLDMEAWETP